MDTPAALVTPESDRPVFLCVLREYNQFYYEDENDLPLWMHHSERFVSARNPHRAESLFIQTLKQEVEDANNQHGEGSAYLPTVADRQIEVIDWTGKWREHYSEEDFLRVLITDLEPGA